VCACVRQATYVVACAITLRFLWDGFFTQTEGIFLLILYCVYLAIAIWSSRRDAGDRLGPAGPDRQTDRQRDRLTDKLTDRQTDRQISADNVCMDWQTRRVQSDSTD
jgi:Ca2+/Na+ antiporter